ncbi:hypothetical protein GCM10010313_80980 [Streptomyces violarus]|uniref:Enoyl reductase (ER) domain-containing protein n=1 Tax=Streptomyces violarus TaxID=67380 RepID=A0A7W4ZYK8_9ACTN|nr:MULTISPECIES: alcohol dehydrogenase catalytic domain-containing protein [Streptomyces]MBB3080826.1 hypothetical protein [Streptomyces violarus]WRT96188.1 alcohol dehydrogenase catalytic domain-containing protein [Streptomyces sp. CGMCC 4.1772]GHD34403.1 hypothetical protein GCM10010313_80980 [Streptomyces violarus]
MAAELLSCPDERDEIAYRCGTRHVARLRNARLDEHERRRTTVDRAHDRVALTLARAGDLDSFEFVAQSRRRPGPGEVEVRLEATSVNFINVLQAMGVYQRFSAGEERPDVSAFDGAGVVTAVGDGVRDVRVGDRVAEMFVDGAQTQGGGVDGGVDSSAVGAGALEPVGVDESDGRQGGVAGGTGQRARVVVESGFHCAADQAVVQKLQAGLVGW